VKLVGLDVPLPYLVGGSSSCPPGTGGGLVKYINWGGRRDYQPGRPKKPESEKYIKRQISLPPDVSALLDMIPTRQRSALIAQALRDYWKRHGVPNA